MSGKTIYKTAIRSGMGIWNYYVSTLSYAEIANYVKMPDEIYQSKKLSEMLQRKLTDNEESIYEYLIKESERFFNSLVLAVYDGNPKWHEGVFELSGEEYTNIGVLELTGDEKIFPVDGQHRVAAIKKMIDNNEANPDEEVPVIYIAHINDEPGIKRTRRLFTTLNRYAKPVKPNEIIALDEDDIVAINTRKLTEDTSYFGNDRIVFSRTESIPPTDKKSFTHLITLYKCNDYLLDCFMFDNKIKNKTGYKRFRQSDEVNEQFYEYILNYWKILVDNNSDLKEYMNLSDADSSKYRNEKGGNLLFRPAGLKAFVSAVCDIHNSTGASFEIIIRKLMKMDLSLDKAPWKNVLWNDGKMVMNNNTLVKFFFIFYYDNKWKDKKGKPLDIDKKLESYKALLGDVDLDNKKLIENIMQNRKK